MCGRMPWMLLTYLRYFVVVTLLFPVSAKVQLLYQVNDLLTIVCKHVNDLSIHYTTPKSLDSQIVFAVQY